MTYYAWFSEKKASTLGSTIYVRPDGSEVEVTYVDSAPQHKTAWDDMVYIGEVTEYKRQGRRGKCGQFDQKYSRVCIPADLKR